MKSSATCLTYAIVWATCGIIGYYQIERFASMAKATEVFSKDSIHTNPQESEKELCSDLEKDRKP